MVLSTAGTISPHNFKSTYAHPSSIYRSRFEALGHNTLNNLNELLLCQKRPKSTKLQIQLELILKSKTPASASVFSLVEP
ncbi:hypothetical protein QL285_093665 [Trifolium repens]|nr:hypothetical protein QL285_093665 [Trifolium repens]